MGKHTKKKPTPSLPPLRGERKRDPYEDLLRAAAREGMIDDPFGEVTEPEESVPESVVPASARSAPELPAEKAPETPAEAKAREPVSEKKKEAEPGRRPRRPEGSRPRNAGRRGAPSRKKKRRRKNRFRRGLRIYVIIMLVLIAAILAALWVFLDRYQQRRDAEAAEEARILAEQAEQRAHEAAVRRAPQDAFDLWRQSVTADTLTDLWFENNPGDVLESREMIRSYMDEHLSAAEPFRATEYTAAAPVYVLRDGDVSLIKARVSGSDVNWSVTETEFLPVGKESASVRAFTGSRVFCNGVELGSEYAGELETKFDFEPLANQLVNPVGWTTYTVSDLLLPPELTAESPAEGSVTETAEGDFLLCLSDTSGKPYSDRAIAFMRAYQYYYMSGLNNTWGNLYAALAYLVPGTTAYQTLYDTKIGVEWNTAYGDIDTSNTTAGPVVLWADNCYSVDVTYAPTGLLNGQRVNYDGAGTMRVYFLRGNDGTFYISHFQPIY